MTWSLLSFWWIVAIILFYCKFGQVFSCLNGYSGRVIGIGRKSTYTPKKSHYWRGDIVKFRCSEGYHFEKFNWRLKSYIWIECMENGWLDPWPVCRGPLENLTCHNRYEQSIKETANWKYPLYAPKHEKYKTLSSVKFKCPKGMYFRGSSGLSHAVSKCKVDQTWSGEWPMCQGHTCEPLNLPNGIVDGKHLKLSPGTLVNIRCRFGYHLFGSNTSTCTESLGWTGYSECVTMDQFKERCDHYSNSVYLLDGETPRCVGDKITAIDHSYNSSKRITLSVAVPLSAMFFILLAVSVVYARRLRLRNAEMAHDVRYNNADQTLQLVLPSYEESMKSKPTTPPPTFEETFSFADDPSQGRDGGSSPIRCASPPRSPFRYGSPPPYDCYMDS